MIRSKFPDEERPLPPERPKSISKMSELHSCGAMFGSLLLACGGWFLIKDGLSKEKQWRVVQMQDMAEVQQKPLVIKEKTTTFSNKVVWVLSWKEPTQEEQTTTINLPWKVPAITIANPKETIIADEDGKVQKIIPHENNTWTISTPKEAQDVVDETLESAAKKTLPEDKSPLIPPTSQKN